VVFNEGVFYLKQSELKPALLSKTRRPLHRASVVREEDHEKRY